MTADEMRETSASAARKSFFIFVDLSGMELLIEGGRIITPPKLCGMITELPAEPDPFRLKERKVR